MTVRWGIAGLGRLADQSIAPAIAASTTGEVVACAGRDFDRAWQFAARHGIERAYPSYQELVLDPAVDAVFVATPNHLHPPVVTAAAAAGKAVLCEKPMALTVKEAEEMIDACRKAGVLLRVGLQMRFHPVLRAATEMVTAGRLGAIREVSVQRCSPLGQAVSWRKSLASAGAGVIADTGVHVLDFLQWVLSDRPARVFATSDPPRSTGHPDETATILLQFSRGCQATIRLSREVPFGANDLQIFGTEGTLSTGSLKKPGLQRITLRTSAGEEIQESPVGDLYLMEIEAFARELAGERTALATGEEGLELTRLTEAVIGSLETGTVSHMPDDHHGG